MHAVTASSSAMPSVYSFFSDPRANTEPEPMAWNLRSSYRPPATS